MLHWCQIMTWHFTACLMIDGEACLSVNRTNIKRTAPGVAYSAHHPTEVCTVRNVPLYNLFCWTQQKIAFGVEVICLL